MRFQPLHANPIILRGSGGKECENLRQIINNSNKKGQIYNNSSVMRLIRAERKAACDGFTWCRVQARSLRVRLLFRVRASASFCLLGLGAERVLKSFFSSSQGCWGFLLKFNVSYVSRGILNGDVFFLSDTCKIIFQPHLIEGLLSFLDEKDQKNTRIFLVKKEGI